MTQGLDYSNGTIDGHTIVNAGYSFVIRYITSPQLANPSGGLKKHTTPAEYASHRAAGLTVYFVYQGTTADADGGFGMGVANAQKVKAGWKWLGSGPTLTFFTNDRPTLPSPATWRAYLDGAASVLGKEFVGGYGFFNAINAGLGHASAWWQSGRESDVLPATNIYQWNNGSALVGGKTCDINRLKKPILQGDTLSWTDPSGVVDANGVPYSYGVLVDYTNRYANLLPDIEASVGTVQAEVESLKADIATIKDSVTHPVTIDYAALAKALIQEIKNG